MKHYIITYKCGHFAPAPPYIVTDTQAKNYSRWAKGQGLCLNCLGDRRMDQAYVHAQQHLYADLQGTYKQVRWALDIRQKKLTEMNLAHHMLVAFDQEPEHRERLRLAHEKLARSTKAETWIAARDLTIDELTASALKPSS